MNQDLLIHSFFGKSVVIYEHVEETQWGNESTEEQQMSELWISRLLSPSQAFWGSQWRQKATASSCGIESEPAR
jgi:hypothetical protein